MTGAVEAEISRMLHEFRAAGARLVELPVLQPAETLLDLYGEDIRARAYTTRDPLAGELMLRPDFTVPVVQMHEARGDGEARYAYAGRVFRMQEPGSDRPSEFDQVGYESFGAQDPAAADAEVFALFARVLGGLPLRAATGDIGIVTAAVRGLDTSERRKAALMRHLWRPGRFRRLLERYAQPAPAREFAAAEAPHIGLRSEAEIAERIAWLREEADTPPLAMAQVDLLNAILGLRDKAPGAADSLRAIAAEMPAIGPAVARLERRLEALSARGVDVDTLDFEGSYGRTSMEYYDGFVFGFYADAGPERPAVATGGRYDALTRALGGSAAAVGGMVRPALTAELAR